MNTTTDFRPATPKMVTYLYWRLAERSSFAKDLEPYGEFMAKMQKAVAERHPQASYTVVRDLIDAVVKIDADTTPARPAPAPRPDVPAGYYALVNGNDGKTYFFKVDRPTEGKWAGYTFLRRISGENELKVGRTEQTQILAAIARNPLEAAKRYGHETGTCGICHRRLTDAASVAAGIGPVCAKKF